VLFERTSTGSSHTGVSIWDTDGIVFEQCTLKNMASNGIRSWDAIFNVKKKNRFSGSEIAILSGASSPISGQIKVGVLGLIGDDRNKFEDNVVGIRATANSRVEIFSNDFENINFDVAINGTTQSRQTDNYFASPTAGNQFDNTGENFNYNLCNYYQGNIVGTNIVGKNTGFLFRQEDFATDFHDLFLEGPANNPGAIQMSQGSFGDARYNYFSAGKLENIKTSTILPNNNTILFFYFHPDPAINTRLKPKCASNDQCIPQNNFNNYQSDGFEMPNCIAPAPPPPSEPCATKPCLDNVRMQIAQKTAQYAVAPSTALAGEIQSLVTQREYITDMLIGEYLATSNWSEVETLLNEDMNSANRRRMVGAKLEQSQFSAAGALLQSFSQNTVDDQYFVQTQGINVARLSMPGFNLNSSQEAVLTSIAESSSPEAGYAQTLLGILKGITFMPTVPDLDPQRNGQVPVKPNLSGALQVSPNPVGYNLQVGLPEAAENSTDRVLELCDMATGRLIQSIHVGYENSITISVASFPSGFYVLSLKDQGAVLARQKIAVQH
jgi:hypothetical protein